MKTLCLSIIAISIIALLSVIQIPAQAVGQYDLNDTQIAWAIKLAENSTQFQSLVKGYNYTFGGGTETTGPLSTGGIGLINYGFNFDVYSGPVNPSNSIKLVGVVEDPALTKILNITSEPPATTSGPASIIPEFPFAILVLFSSVALVIGFTKIRK